MNPTARKLLFTLIAGVTLSSYAQAAEPSIDVPKNDGTLTRYKLLPVHFDASHAAVVNNRLSSLSLNSSAPSSYQIALAKLPPVRDQGQRGTCAYFSTVGAIESYYIRKTPSVHDTLKVSEECLVDLRNWEFDQGSAYTGKDDPGQRPDPNGDLPASIIMSVNSFGVPASGTYSNGVNCVYNGDNTNGNDVSLTQYNQLFAEGSAAYGKNMNFTLNTAPTFDSIKASILNNVPVVIGIVVYNDYMNGYNWVYNAKTDTSDQIAGGHAILLTGYTVTNGKTIFTFKNSWGADWGNAGYGTMDEGVLTNSWGYDPSYDFTVSLN